MITNPKLMDSAVLELNAALKENISWLTNAYGKVELLREDFEGQEKIYPAVYLGKNEYLKMFPDENLGNFSYVDIRDITSLDHVRRLSFETNTEMSVVFWFDYRLIEPSNPDGVTIENVKHELSQFFLKYPFLTFKFDITSFSEQVDNVYNGLSHEVINNQFNMRPYGCLKITGNVRYRQLCGNPTVPVVTLPAEKVVSLKTINGESIEGSGDIEILSGGGFFFADTPTVCGNIGGKDVYVDGKAFDSSDFTITVNGSINEYRLVSTVSNVGKTIIMERQRYIFNANELPSPSVLETNLLNRDINGNVIINTDIPVSLTNQQLYGGSFFQWYTID